MLNKSTHTFRPSRPIVSRDVETKHVASSKQLSGDLSHHHVGLLTKMLIMYTETDFVLCSLSACIKPTVYRPM